MDALLKLIQEQPSWVPLFLSVVANAVAIPWLARNWMQSQGLVIDLAREFGGAVEASNVRLDTMQRSLDRLEARD